MPNTVLEIKEKVEAILRQYDLKVKLNSVLLNLYRNEKDSVAWHSDDELSLGICPTIASVSLGTTRKFEMRPKENVRDYGAKDIIYVNLTHGSLIVMDGVMQQDWQHRVPKEFHDRGPRINLTFRTIYPLDQLPPEVPRVSSMKSAKSPSEKVMHQQDPKFDAESFPPLGMEASDKKTKLLPKENGDKDYPQPSVQRKSPKEFRGSIEKKTKSLSKSYQKSVYQRKSQKAENWDDEMLQGVEDTPATQNNLNKKSCHDPITNSPEAHPSHCDFNLNVKGSTELYNEQFPCGDFGKSEYYSNSSETSQPHSYEPTDNHLLESKDLSPPQSKPVEIEVETVDFNSNVEESAELCNKQYNYETTDNRLEFKDPGLSESKSNKIKEEPIEIDAKISDSGKKYSLNANAPDFVPLNRFRNCSLHELLELYKQLRNEELHSFMDAILKCAYAGWRMHKAEINTRDLFYSNPADHFLSNEAKTSVESGFSSSFGYSHSGGNSKELLNSTSQDLFNLTPKISGCEGQTSNRDYQKYISQNLFTKKGKTSRKFSFVRNENQWNDEEKHTPKAAENQNDFHEIKNIEIRINDMHTAFETYLTEIKNYYEEKLHENIDDLKTLINSSNSKLRAMISSQKVNEIKTGLYRNYNGAAQQNEPNTFESTRSGFVSRPLSMRSIPNLNSNYEWRNNNPSSYQNSTLSYPQRSVHTPLADIIHRKNKISPTERNMKGKDESPFTVKKADISPYSSPAKRKLPRACKQNYSQRCTQMNFKRKISTPIIQTKQLMKQKKKSAGLNATFSGNQVNDSKTPPMRSRQRRVNTTRAETIMSSPYLTLYETMRAEEFTFI
ncbi:unnamed protein product [Larinioides sclopetarius]|uniref:Fe2OG dioxygenase domain-containing protein n=1 Tax=Larinioides sclopetarius TaxID=280406 RepID=A0AAV2B8X1_9ARAC